jgi:hypothetical protein
MTSLLFGPPSPATSGDIQPAAGGTPNASGNPTPPRPMEGQQNRAWEKDAVAQLAELRKRIAGHADEPAEKVFKNIEILKGKKAAVLPMMMAGLSGSLGVNCTHCHIRDEWDREDKAAKQVARKHFDMQAALLKQYFNRENKVSCWTCHRGEPVPPIQPRAK